MASPYIVRRTAYFSMKTPNRPGQGARILSGLAAHGVNLVAFTGFPTGGGAQVDFMPYNPKKFVEAAGKLGYKVSAKKTVFIATGKDRTGAVASNTPRSSFARPTPDCSSSITAPPWISLPCQSASPGCSTPRPWRRPPRRERPPPMNLVPGGPANPSPGLTPGNKTFV